MRELNDPSLRKVKDEYDQRLLEFIRGHTNQILEQVKSDTDYQSGKNEVPRIPVFDQYLSGLEAEIKASVAKAGFFNGVAGKLIDLYKTTFYYSSLPNLSENHAAE